MYWWDVRMNRIMICNGKMHMMAEMKLFECDDELNDDYWNWYKLWSSDVKFEWLKCGNEIKIVLWWMLKYVIGEWVWLLVQYSELRLNL